MTPHEKLLHEAEIEAQNIRFKRERDAIFAKMVYDMLSSPPRQSRILNWLEDHFTRKGNWWALCRVMQIKRALGMSLHRGGWDE